MSSEIAVRTALRKFRETLPGTAADNRIHALAVALEEMANWISAIDNRNAHRADR